MLSSVMFSPADPMVIASSWWKSGTELHDIRFFDQYGDCLLNDYNSQVNVIFTLNTFLDPSFMDEKEQRVPGLIVKALVFCAVRSNSRSFPTTFQQI